MSIDDLRRLRQCSIKEAVTISGIGLHSGAHSTLVVQPAPVNAGIVFRRLDAMSPVDGVADGPAFRNAIPATPEHVVRSDHGTTLANAFGASVATVEHIMAALAIAQIDNAVIDIDGPEVPILDGSAAPFLAEFHRAGLRCQKARRDEITLGEPIAVSEGDRSIVISPADAFSMHVEIDFEDCLIGRQSLSIAFSNSDDVARLASARTFCRLYEVDALRRAGLIRGGSLDNSIVIDGERLLNEQGLRDSQEFVLHKALDLIGDLYLLGAPLRAEIRAIRPGHDLNCRAALAVSRRNIPASVAATA